MTKMRSLGVTFGLVTMVVGCGSTDDQDEIRMSVAKIETASTASLLDGCSADTPTGCLTMRKPGKMAPGYTYIDTAIDQTRGLPNKGTWSIRSAVLFTHGMSDSAASPCRMVMCSLDCPSRTPKGSSWSISIAWLSLTGTAMSFGRRTLAPLLVRMVAGSAIRTGRLSA